MTFRSVWHVYGHRHGTRDETPHASSLGWWGGRAGGREGGPDPGVQALARPDPGAGIARH